MRRPKDKWAEVAAGLCGAAALGAYYGLKNDAVAVLALIMGVLIPAWSYLDVRR
jgi:hypothetical protein